ncbi:hypothetical protein STEG23_019418, partial [Scotinomys teguina]
MQPGRTTNPGGGTMKVKAAAPRCQLLLILLMSAVMLLPGTNGSLLLVQRTVTRTILLQETIGKETQEWAGAVEQHPDSITFSLSPTPHLNKRTALPGAGARDPATKLGALFVRDFPRVYLPDCRTHTSNTGYFN